MSRSSRYRYRWACGGRNSSGSSIRTMTPPMPACCQDSSPAISPCAGAVAPVGRAQPSDAARSTAARTSSATGWGAVPGPVGATIGPSRRSAGKKSAGGRADPSPRRDPKARRRRRSSTRRRARPRSGSTRSRPCRPRARPPRRRGAASGSRSAQIAVSRFDLPVLCSPTIAEIVPGRKLVSFSDRNPRTWTPVSPKAGTADASAGRIRGASRLGGACVRNPHEGHRTSVGCEGAPQ